MKDDYNKLQNKWNQLVLQYDYAYQDHHEAFRKFAGYKSTKDKLIFQRSCSQPDCKGFLSQKGVCGICNIHVCLKCNACKGTEKEEIHNHENG